MSISGRDPFQKPDFVQREESLKSLTRRVQEILKARDLKASAWFPACRLISVAEQTVITTFPRAGSHVVASYVTAWEDAFREALGRLVVLVVRAEDPPRRGVA